MTQCAKYADWMDEAALGALASGREAELLAHAAGCEDCRVAYEHARELVALVDHGVESLMAGPPSAHFATRLRARIAEERVPSRSAWATWKPIAAGLAIALVAAVVLVSRGPQWQNRQPAPAVAHSEAAHNANPTLAVSPQAEAGLNAKPATNLLQGRRPPAGRSGSYGSSSRGQALTARASSRRNLVHYSTAPAQAEVIVPPGQLAAVMQFAEAIQSGRIDGKQVLTAEQQLDKPLAIQPLEIKPIEIGPGFPSSDVSSQPLADSTRP